ncbi:cupin domain-containing protein [Streptomyces sp. Je 1-79]|uniref:cupin domain-containing protein n=1 Tax=Streptomyces sp. Je 1-79 TaxID=2943847 RepID=UPI0021A8C9F6|nr:cupin domain-containing protein [Streptomyces sp. Je 1-79]MCT4354579.1 cupin domain-containing protein [Streptomyces sp. Je 1-79]
MPFTAPIPPPGEPAVAATPYGGDTTTDTTTTAHRTGGAMADRTPNRFRIDRSSAKEEFGLACQRLIPWAGADEDPPVGAMACFLAPGGDSDPDCHNQDEVMLILSGTGSVTLDGVLEPPFHAGDLVVLPRNQEHVVHNTGAVELSWVSLYWPLRETAVRTENEEVAA